MGFLENEKKNIENEIISKLRDEKFSDIEAQIINQLDVDFSVVKHEIKTMQKFDAMLKEPFLKSDKKIFYRGERINERSRPLIPTILRNREALFDTGDVIVDVDADFIFDYYDNLGDYLELYERVMEPAKRESMYRLCAFSQHYLDVSPFVDFTKSLYVALSFGLKNRSEYKDDLVLYTVQIVDENDYTEDEKTADRWLSEYHVHVFRRREEYLKDMLRGKKGFLTVMQQVEHEKETLFKMGTSPSAKMIDIPTNDLMRFQQGAFLMLTDFKLVFDSYPTKSIRDDFKVTKWIISKELCPLLLKMINTEAPWYSYDCLLDVKKAFTKAASSSLPLIK